MPFNVAGGNISKIAYDNAKEAKETANKANTSAGEAKVEASGAKEVVQQFVEGELDSGVARTKIDEKLNELEERYAPDLNSVKSDLAQTTKFNFQSSFVETVKGLLFFKAMYFKKLTNTSLEVILVTGDNRHITHTFTAKSDGYLISFNCYTGQWQQAPSTSNYKWSDISANAKGAWIAGDPAVVYTTTVGSTVSVTFDASENATFSATLFKDDRGGLMKFTLDDDETVTISEYSPTIQTVPQEIFRNISEGTHTVKVEFLGADPENAPRGGTARGWLADTRHTLFSVDSMSFTNTNELELFAIGSNREFAFRFAPETTTETEWVPYHTTLSAVTAKPPRVRLNGITSPLTVFTIGKLEKIEDFSLLQHIYARHTQSGEINLLDIRTVQSINRQEGTFRVSGALETLENVNMNDSYVMMGAVNNALFDRLLTGIGNTIPAVKADNTITFLQEEEDKVKEYAFVSSNNDYVVAYNNVDLRRNMAYGTPQYKRISNFLQHRNESILKHYVNIFDKVLIPKGFKYSWGGEYAVGKIEGIRSMLEQSS